jgi:tetratricopeptide (TPR) repeat protein
MADNEVANDERKQGEDLREDAELEKLLESANTKKLEANQQFAEGHYDKALEIYAEALELAPLKFTKERAVILSNCAAANIKLEKWDCAINNATESIELGSPNEKSLERRAFAYSQGDDNLDKAIEDYKKLRDQFPNRHVYSQHITKLEERLNARNERMKAEMIDQLKNLGNMCLRPFGLSTDSFQMVEQPGGGYSIQMKK